MTYKLPSVCPLEGTTPNAVIKIDSNDQNIVTWIPLDVDGVFQDEYQEWLAAGNTPQPADS